MLEHEQLSGNELSGPLRLLTSPFVPVRLFPPTANVDGLTNSIGVTLHESETMGGF